MCLTCSALGSLSCYPTPWPEGRELPGLLSLHFEDESFVGLLLLLPWPVVVSVLENFGFGSPVVVVVCVQFTFPFVRSNVPPDVSQSCWLLPRRSLLENSSLSRGMLAAALKVLFQVLSPNFDVISKPYTRYLSTLYHVVDPSLAHP